MTPLPLTRSPRPPHDKARALRRIPQTPFSAPATSAYLLVLVATTAVLGSSSAETDNQLLLSVSTNLHQLAQDPVRVLIASAFWTSGWSELALWAALFAAILGPVERRLGWRRTTLTFAAGHIGATLIVATGLWIGIQLGAADPADVLARDVGASYGFFAVATLAAYLFTPRYQTRYLAAIIGSVVATAALFHTFTDFGHLAAVAIGLICYRLVRNQTGRSTGRNPGKGHDPRPTRSPGDGSALNRARRRAGNALPVRVVRHGTFMEAGGARPVATVANRTGPKSAWRLERTGRHQLACAEIGMESGHGQCEPDRLVDNKAVGVDRRGTMSNDGTRVLRRGVRYSQVFLSVLSCWDASIGSD